MNIFTKLTKSLLNLIYPLHCASCGKRLAVTDELGACNSCISGIKRNPLPYCPRCGRSTDDPSAPCAECNKMHPVFIRGYSACLYEGTLKDMIHMYKYKKRRSLARLFAKVMLDYIKDIPEVTEGVTLITFVPLHRKRYAERGFNQSELIAILLGKELGIPVKGVLEKIFVTKHQNELSREERLMNVVAAFRTKKNMKDVVKDADMLIIDDVMTTAATLNETSRALLGAGARTARCLTLARGI